MDTTILRHSVGECTMSILYLFEIFQISHHKTKHCFSSFPQKFSSRNTLVFRPFRHLIGDGVHKLGANVETFRGTTKQKSGNFTFSMQRGVQKGERGKGV